MKRTISNGGDAGRNANAGQAAATRKRIVPDAGDAGRNADAGQAAATLKRKISNVGDGIGDGDGAGFTYRALDEAGLGFVVKDAICTAIVWVSCIHRNRSQAAAIRKRIESNASDAGRNADTGQAAATIKRNVPNACDAGRDGDAGQAAATLKRIVPNTSDAGRNADAGQAAATLKRKISNVGDGIGDGDGAGFTCRALDEGGLGFVIKDAICTAIVRVSCIHRNRSQAAAIRKRIGSNASDAGRNGDAGQSGIALE